MRLQHQEAIAKTKAFSKLILDSTLKAEKFYQLKSAPTQIPKDFSQVMGNYLWYAVATDDQIIAPGLLHETQSIFEALFVMPTCQGRGVAKMRLQHQEAIAKTKGLSKQILDSTLNAEKFYQKHGYQKIKDSIHKVHLED